jgi:hypothetical protein
MNLRRYSSRHRQQGMLTLNSLSGFWQGKSSFIVDAADFDGTNDYMARGANLTGIADSKTGIMSVWFKLDTLPTSNHIRPFLDGTDTTDFAPEFYAAVNDTGECYVGATDSLGSTVFNLSAGTGAVSAGNWYHMLASWDTSTNVGSLYLNDVQKTTAPGAVNANVPYTSVPNWTAGWITTGGIIEKLDGGLAEVYFAPGQYLDFTVASNRRRFIGSNLKPVDLGATGSKPTGTAPIVYFHLADLEAPANFATNRGTGGNFTVTGALTTYATSPSD